MIQAMYPTLKEWENSLKFVMIQGSGGKSFCAGGDIVSITSLAKGKNLHSYGVASLKIEWDLENLRVQNLDKTKAYLIF